MNETELADMVTSRFERFSDELSKDERVDYEVPYNYYGSRGVADLVTYNRYSDDSGGYTTVYELKADHALEHVTGPNEILRQFNRMRRNFAQDENNDVYTDGQTVSYSLVFAPTVKCVNHVLENLSFYRSVKTPAQRGFVSDKVEFAIEPTNINGIGGRVNSNQIQPLSEDFMRNIKDGGRLHEAIQESRFESGVVVGQDE